MTAKASAIKRYVASAVCQWCLGRIYILPSDFHSGYNYLQEAYQLFNKLPPGNAPLKMQMQI